MSKFQMKVLKVSKVVASRRRVEGSGHGTIIFLFIFLLTYNWHTIIVSCVQHSDSTFVCIVK